MSSSIRLAAGASFFLLDDEGVFFCERTQELYRFNTSASWLWCALEEGLDLREMTGGFARAFETPLDQADSIVSATLGRWQRLGYIEGADLPGSTSDLASPLVADPAAPRSESGPRARRPAPARETRTVSEARGVDLAHPPPTVLPPHCYRLLGSTFALYFDEPGPGPIERVHAAMAHLEVSGDEDTDVQLVIRREGDAYRLLIDGVQASGCADESGLAPLVKGELRRLAVNRHCYFMELHAGVLLAGDACLLLPGRAGSGKTTLTAELLHRGMQYLSDETALLVGPELEIRPVPLGLCVKPGSLAMLAHRYPELRIDADHPLPVHQRQDGQAVRYLRPPAHACLDDPNASYPAAWLVFPRVSRQRPTELRSIARADALQRLMAECVSLPALLDRARVARLVRWMRGLACFELEMSALPRAAELMRRLTA